ncbi:pleckstrin homology domain-containing family A member 8-like [Anabrus simplex]|uniref:pleckstrin homology domain-containing family A member 8-like n=1 Tax=Anabrus simplex TaxID=316456 RepID=UPI0034DD53CE
MAGSNRQSLPEAERTYLNTLQTPFPSIVDGKIETEDFLEAVKGVLVLIEKFRQVFAPIKFDMWRCLETLEERYVADKTTYRYLTDMINQEQAEGGMRVTESLLWLKRALHFLHSFLQYIVDDTEEDDVEPMLKRAYEETLHRYHGWMAQQLMMLLYRMCPRRSEIYRTLALGHEDREEAVKRTLITFLTELGANIEHISQFYEMHNLESNSWI